MAIEPVHGGVVVICVGNEYAGDDGLGPAVAACLRERYRLDPAVEVVDRAVMGYGMILDFLGCQSAVVVDALDGTGALPGALFGFEPEDMAGAADAGPSLGGPCGIASLHEVRVSDVIAAARFMGARCAVHCFGAQIASRPSGGLARGLSAPVAAAVEPLAMVVAEYLNSRSIMVRRK